MQEPPAATRATGRAIVATLAIAAALSALAGWVSLSAIREYHRIAPYHYDSAANRFEAVWIHDLLQAQGLRRALAFSLHSKDGPDRTLRLLVAPRTLLHPHGHLVVFVPLLGVFFALLLWYARRRTGSLLAGMAAALSLFALKFAAES